MLEESGSWPRRPGGNAGGDELLRLRARTVVHGRVSTSARRPPAAGGVASAGVARERRFWGWGFEGEGLDRAAREGLGGLVAPLVGGGPRGHRAPHRRRARPAGPPPGGPADAGRLVPHRRPHPGRPHLRQVLPRRGAGARPPVGPPARRGRLPAGRGRGGGGARVGVGGRRRRHPLRRRVLGGGRRGGPGRRRPAGDQLRPRPARPGPGGRPGLPGGPDPGGRPRPLARRTSSAPTASPSATTPRASRSPRSGGWLATRSGGHFATLQTHIDDFVESIRAVTPAGRVGVPAAPGSGAGPSPDRLLLGSEGIFGVITEAWMRLQRPADLPGVGRGPLRHLRGGGRAPPAPSGSRGCGRRTAGCSTPPRR